MTSVFCTIDKSFSNLISFLTSAEFNNHPQMVACLIPLVELDNVIMTHFMRQPNLHNQLVPKWSTQTSCTWHQQHKYHWTKQD